MVEPKPTSSSSSQPKRQRRRIGMYGACCLYVAVKLVMNGIGGDLFAIICHTKQKKSVTDLMPAGLQGLNARERLIVIQDDFKDKLVVKTNTDQFVVPNELS